jgi:hypothetical protein
VGDEGKKKKKSWIRIIKKKLNSIKLFYILFQFKEKEMPTPGRCILLLQLYKLE